MSGMWALEYLLVERLSASLPDRPKGDKYLDKVIM